MPVPAADPVPGIVSVDEVNEWLRFTDTDTARDTVVERLIDAVTELIEAEVGPVVAREATIDRDGGTNPLIVTAPLLSITTVTTYSGGTGTSYSEDDPTASPPSYGWRANLGAGLLYATSGTWPYGSLVRVVAVVGRESVPANIRQAALEQIRMWWEASQNPSRPEFGFDAETVTPNLPAAGLHPFVLKMLAPQRLGPAVA